MPEGNHWVVVVTAWDGPDARHPLLVRVTLDTDDGSETRTFSRAADAGAWVVELLDTRAPARTAGHGPMVDRAALEDMLDRTAIADVITRFQRAFDDHRWGDLRGVLADRVTADYAGLRQVPPATMSAEAFLEARRDALDHLLLQHNHLNLEVILDGDTAVARCNFLIFRFLAGTEDSFHSWGQYRFGLHRDGRHWVIDSIRQTLLRNEGNPALHRGVPTT